MNTKLTSGSFPDFDYHVAQIIKYIRADEIFTIMLKDGSIIHHITQQHDLFEKWLMENDIINIKNQY